MHWIDAIPILRSKLWICREVHALTNALGNAGRERIEVRSRSVIQRQRFAVLDNNRVAACCGEVVAAIERISGFVVDIGGSGS
jgi:hypothetical protein